MTLRGAFVIAVLLECLLALIGWYLRIQGYRGLPVLLGVYLPALLAFLWIFLRNFRPPASERRPFPRDPWLALITLASIIVVPLGGLGFHQKSDPLAILRFMAYLPLLLAVEGLFFRGILQGALERVLHPLAAILLGALGVVAIHLPVIGFDLVDMSINLCTGVVLGVIYTVTRNLLLVTAVHIFGDWALVLPLPVVLDSQMMAVLNVALTLAAIWWLFRKRGWSLNSST